MKTLLIPVKSNAPGEYDVKLVPIMSVLSQKGEIIGLEFIRDITFESSSDLFTKKKIVGYIRLIFYLFKTIIYGFKKINQYDLIFCEHLYSVLAGSILSIFSRKPCIWDSHGNLLEACKQLNNSMFYTKLTLVLENIVKDIPKLMVVPTYLDKQLYVKQGFDANKIAVIPPGVNLSDINKIKGSKNDIRKRLGLLLSKRIILFTGSRNYRPNKDAAFWINDKLASVIGSYFDDIQIIITGSGDMPSNINPIVNFIGYVPSIYEYIIASDICIAPVVLDNGISTKLLDYMACGKPIIVLSSVVRGMPQVIDGKDLIVAKDKDEFIKKTIDMLNDLDNVQKMGLNARKIIEKYFNWELLQIEWSKLIEKNLNES